MTITSNEKYLEGFTNLVHFLGLFRDFDLKEEEMKLLIYRFFKGYTYDDCAKYISRGYSRQNAEEQIKKIIRRIKNQAIQMDKLEDFRYLLHDLTGKY